MKLSIWKSEHWTDDYGGPKAKRDVHEIVLRMHGHEDGSEIEELSFNHPLSGSCCSNKNVVLQFPTRDLISSGAVSDGRRIDRFVQEWILRWENRIIFIHDLKTLQIELFDSNLSADDRVAISRAEAQILKSATMLIVHTPAMEKYIRTTYSLSNVTCRCLYLFDYLCDDRPFGEFDAAGRVDRSQRIVYCGNLQGTSLARELTDDLPSGPRISYQFFGNAVNHLHRADFHVNGRVRAEHLPGILARHRFDFGLCWWAQSIIDSGYLDLVAPHKASCYLAAGLPLVCPSKSYLAEFVVANEVGVAIDSLPDLLSSLSSISDIKRRRMKDRARELSRLIRAGHFTNQAFSGVLS